MNCAITRQLIWVTLSILALWMGEAARAKSNAGLPEVGENGLVFTNSLHMPFVHFGAPSAIICIWETRNCDYLLFVSETGRKWRNVKECKNTPLHPAVLVSWDDAKAFCEWLTLKERSERLIGSNWCYRLPTDLEWGKALGLARERGKSPAERFFYGGPALPWGETWPPPVGIANLGRRLGVDDWKYTAPVGSFPTNGMGLYDMVGNVSEWCEDLYDLAGTTERVFRGTSYGSTSRNECAASVRLPARCDDAMPNVGFRCVLDQKVTADKSHEHGGDKATNASPVK